MNVAKLQCDANACNAYARIWVDGWTDGADGESAKLRKWKGYDVLFVLIGGRVESISVRLTTSDKRGVQIRRTVSAVLRSEKAFGLGVLTIY